MNGFTNLPANGVPVTFVEVPSKTSMPFPAPLAVYRKGAPWYPQSRSPLGRPRGCHLDLRRVRRRGPGGDPAVQIGNVK